MKTWIGIPGAYPLALICAVFLTAQMLALRAAPAQPAAGPTLQQEEPAPPEPAQQPPTPPAEAPPPDQPIPGDPAPAPAPDRAEPEPERGPAEPAEPTDGTRGQPETPPVQERVAQPAPSERPSAPTDVTSPPETAASAADTNGVATLRLNFRGAPLDLVLNYLSEAAGFIIILETDVKGKVDVWSNQPLTQNEAVDLLNTVLSKNGYTALRNGRTLTIVSREDAKKRDIPVKSGNNPDAIPKNEAIVTQIIPVRFISATPLARDLQALLPAQATLTANEGGNALVLTDTQTNIKRMAEIVRALDTAISSVSSVRVFSLTNADAKALATVITQLFQPQQDATRGAQAGRFFQLMRGGGPGGQGQGGQVDLSGGRAPTLRVVAVADERSNSVVVSAPEEQMPIVEDVILRMDRDVEDITELRVFRLKFADPQEMADLLADLFPDTTTTSATAGNRGQIQFGGPAGGPGGRFGGTRQNAGGDQSARLQKQTRVVTAPDLRTRSIVVSAARDLMDQIARMIEMLDSDPARKQKVHVFNVQNTDPQAVGEIIETLFPNQNYRGSSTSRSTTRQAGSQLNTRATSTQNQSTRNTSNLGGSSFGTSGSGTGR